MVLSKYHKHNIISPKNNASAPGELAPMNPTNPNNPNGIPIEPTKGCEFNKPQRPLAYVLNVSMSTPYDMDIIVQSFWLCCACVYLYI